MASNFNVGGQGLLDINIIRFGRNLNVGSILMASSGPLSFVVRNKLMINWAWYIVDDVT